ncbi:MAG: dihydroorotase [Deltaproteobacteria bacterium]|nr:dihydroorotase [Deltaproteobacteria bacterium]
MKPIVIKNGRVVDPSGKIDGIYDISIAGGKITSLSNSGEPEGEGSGSGVIDATGMVVIPGLIDIHVHLREPGYEYKETIASGAMAAVAGGFTTIACMANTDPVNDNGSVTRYILAKAGSANLVNLFPIGAATKGLGGEVLAEIGELSDAGCVAISDDGLPVADGSLMRKVFEYARTFNLPVITHCEEPAIVGDGVMNEGITSTRLGLRGIPNAAEDTMVSRDISLAELTGGRLHIAHISTRDAVEMVRRAKERGLRVTAEVTPHHLILTDDAVKGYDTNAKMNPPLRGENDREAVIQGLVDGTIDCVATDHAPHSTIEKDIEFDRAANGVVGLETALPLVLRLVEKDILTLSQAIERMTAGPARVLGLDKGTLQVGSDADITIVDMEREWVVEGELFHSKGRNTPFDGWKVKGRTVKTIVGGRVVYSEK